MRPLLDSEVAQGMSRGRWILTDKTIALAGTSEQQQQQQQQQQNQRVAERISRREETETVMDAVFGEHVTTREVYEQSFSSIVAGAAEGLDGAILAYGQTSSGKTYSINGSTAKGSHVDEQDEAAPLASMQHQGIIHFATAELFERLQASATAAGEGADAPIVRMSYCEVYMERVNDLLRKNCPQSQNLSVKEHPENRGFYVDGLTEKPIASMEEAVSLLAAAEKRRRVAHTKYNEVSSRSHTILTLCVQSSMLVENSLGEETVNDETLSNNEPPRVTRVSRLLIVDLAGNERMEAGTEYMAESNSINKSLFFLGKVIELLALRDRRSDGAVAAFAPSTEGTQPHLPVRDSKLTRLLSTHLGGNSQTGLLVTLTPAEHAIDASLSTLRFAQKASLIRCSAKPTFLNREQALIQKQRDLIAQLRMQVRELRDERDVAQDETTQQTLLPEDRAGPEPAESAADSAGQRAVISGSREVDAVVEALHRNCEALRKQRTTVVDEFRDLHRSVMDVSERVAQASAELGTSATGVEAAAALLVSPLEEPAAGASKTSAAWAPAVQRLYGRLQELLQAAIVVSGGASAKSAKAPAAPPSPVEGSQQPVASSMAAEDGAEAKRLREENARLRANVKFLAAERERLRAQMSGLEAQQKDSRDEGLQQRSMAPIISKHNSAEDGLDAGCAEPPSTRPTTASAGQALSSTCHSDRPTSSGGSCSVQRRASAVSTPAPEWPISSGAAASRGCGRGSKPSVSPIRSIHSSGCAVEEFEPIVDRCVQPPQPPPPPQNSVPKRPSEARPLVAADLQAARQSFSKQCSRPAAGLQPGVAANWQVGDVALWRGQVCHVLRSEGSPVRVVLRTPNGGEVTTDACLLSDAAAASGSGTAHFTGCAASLGLAGRPLRLTPLSDLVLDRPASRERAIPKGSLPSTSGGGAVCRSASTPTRARSPLRPLSRDRSHQQKQRQEEQQQQHRLCGVQRLRLSSPLLRRHTQDGRL